MAIIKNLKKSPNEKVFRTEKLPVFIIIIINPPVISKLNYSIQYIQIPEE